MMSSSREKHRIIKDKKNFFVVLCVSRFFFRTDEYDFATLKTKLLPYLSHQKNTESLFLPPIHHEEPK